jgi:alpha-beta hydrolase superfamily lysophospholipase
MKSILTVLIILGSLIGISFAANIKKHIREVTFKTADGGHIFANLYGGGDHAVVLAHGAIFNKESWDSLAQELSAKGFCVLALDFRGYGKSVAGKKEKALYEDVLAAVRYLRGHSTKKVSVIGGSMGGGAVALAAVKAKQGEIDQLILLSPVPIKTPELMKPSKLFIASKGERLMPKVKEQFEKAANPKKLVLLEGSAHAQHIFKTGQAQKLTSLIFEFLASSEKLNIGNVKR